MEEGGRKGVFWHKLSGGGGVVDTGSVTSGKREKRGENVSNVQKINCELSEGLGGEENPTGGGFRGRMGGKKGGGIWRLGLIQNEFRGKDS